MTFFKNRIIKGFVIKKKGKIVHVIEIIPLREKEMQLDGQKNCYCYYRNV
jgi:hypothetical protein